MRPAGEPIATTVPVAIRRTRKLCEIGNAPVDAGGVHAPMSQAQAHLAWKSSKPQKQTAAQVLHTAGTTPVFNLQPRVEAAPEPVPGERPVAVKAVIAAQKKSCQDRNSDSSPNVPPNDSLRSSRTTSSSWGEKTLSRDGPCRCLLPLAFN